MSPAKPPGSIRALVVDDEAPARRFLTLLLRKDPDVGSVIECGSGLEADRGNQAVPPGPCVLGRANARMRRIRRARNAGRGFA